MCNCAYKLYILQFYHVLSINIIVISYKKFFMII